MRGMTWGPQISLKFYDNQCFSVLTKVVDQPADTGIPAAGFVVWLKPHKFFCRTTFKWFHIGPSQEIYSFELPSQVVDQNVETIES